MNGRRASSDNLQEVVEEMREKHKVLLRENAEMRSSLASLKTSMDGINHNTAQIASVLEEQGKLVITTFLRAFKWLVACCILIAIIAVAAMAKMEFQGNSHGIHLSPTTS